jgi:hypothetical protein
MDVNRLYFLHQISLMRVSTAVSRLAGLRHKAEAAGLALRIKDFQASVGAKAATAWGKETVL